MIRYTTGRKGLTKSTANRGTLQMGRRPPRQQRNDILELRLVGTDVLQNGPSGKTIHGRCYDPPRKTKETSE
jgi:hypothetical protein